MGSRYRRFAAALLALWACFALSLTASGQPLETATDQDYDRLFGSVLRDPLQPRSILPVCRDGGPAQRFRGGDRLASNG
jgi:hypothetical protein